MSYRTPDKPDKFAEPVNLEEAHQRQDLLTDEIRIIEAQIADETKRDKMSAHDYAIWKTKATWARALKLNESSYLKRWIKAHNPRNVVFNDLLAQGLNPDDADSLVLWAHHALHSLVMRGVELNATEQGVKNALRAYLEKGRRS